MGEPLSYVASFIVFAVQKMFDNVFDTPCCGKPLKPQRSPGAFSLMHAPGAAGKHHGEIAVTPIFFKSPSNV